MVFHSASKLGTDFDGYQVIDPAERQTQVPKLYGFTTRFAVRDGPISHRAVVAVQIANPFDRPIPPEELAKYRLSVCGMHAPLASCWIDTPDFFPPEPNELSDSLSPLEPVTQDRNSSAIFWLDPSAVNYPNAPSWSPADDVDAQLFKDNLIRWMGITTQQDDLPNVAGEFAIDGSWGSTHHPL